jgi:hypothetical protein
MGLGMANADNSVAAIKIEVFSFLIIPDAASSCPGNGDIIEWVNVE